jgi:hypothetical protein
LYSYFTDRFYGVKDARPIIPRERETFSAPTEEADVEEQLAPPETLKSEVPMETPQSFMPANEPMPEAQLGGTEESQSLVQESPPKVEAPMEAVDAQSAEGEKEKEDDSEPFADILDTPKDKKRYSSNPLPQQPPEQTS